MKFLIFLCLNNMDDCLLKKNTKHLLKQKKYLLVQVKNNFYVFLHLAGDL